jgi:hypothetical protein
MTPGPVATTITKNALLCLLVTAATACGSAHPVPAPTRPPTVSAPALASTARVAQPQ